MSRWHRAGSYGGTRWARLRRAALDRDGWRCTACSRPGRLEVHHLEPLHQGGELWDLANVATLCRACHLEATYPKTAAEKAWRELVAETVARTGTGSPQ